MKYHCLFEQSGTFKNEFKKLGLDAYDYDILNNFGQTDFQMDLFSEIEKAYDGKSTIFDKWGGEDFVLAFFPCTRFEDQIQLYFRGEASQQKKWTEKRKLEMCLDLHKELHHYYELVTKLTLVALDKGFPMMIENPATGGHYLTRYWPIKPKLIDKDRTLNGDYFQKPTQFWFINTDPANNVIFESIQYVRTQIVTRARVDGAENRTESRSMIHPQYANRFIRQYIIKDPSIAGAIPTIK